MSELVVDEFVQNYMLPDDDGRLQVQADCGRHYRWVDARELRRVTSIPCGNGCRT